MAEVSDDGVDVYTKFPAGTLSAHMDTVIADAQARQLSEAEQADVMADNFTGSLVRLLGPEAAKAQLDAVGAAAGNDSNWGRVVTSSEGARRSALQLDASPSGKIALGSLGHRLHADSEGRVAMTSLDQLSAYISLSTEQERAAAKNGVPWKQIIITEINDQLHTPNRRPAWEAADNLTSEVDSVRRSQESWMRAAASARNSGVDVDLVARSVEYIQAHAGETVEESIGEIALLDQPGEFDELFK